MTSPSNELVSVRTRRLDLGGGRVLHASRFTDPTTGHDRVTLVKGWDGDSPLPPRPDGDVVEVSGEDIAGLIAALQALQEEAGHA